MAKYTFFITGTDTGVGETLVSSAILLAAKREALSCVAIKPIACACKKTAKGLRSDDALQLIEQMSAELPYEQINPIAFESSAVPIIAAQGAGRRLSLSQLTGFVRGVLMQRVDLAVIEGLGGWRVLLNSRESLSGLPKELKLPVILVVGIRPGCINQALLTVEAITRDGVKLAGWVANQLVANDKYHGDSVATLKALIDAPCLIELPFLDNPCASSAAAFIEVDKVITASHL